MNLNLTRITLDSHGYYVFILILFIFLIMLCSLSLSSADYLVKSDGKVMEGHLIEKNKNYVAFKGMDNIIYYFKNSEYKSLVVEEKIKTKKNKTTPAIASKNPPLYHGEPVSLDVKDMDVRDLLLSLAKIGNFNIILNNSVQGKITLKLKNVPLDQVVDLICTQFNIGYEILL